jgi:hypothetical protein
MALRARRPSGKQVHRDWRKPVNLGLASVLSTAETIQVAEIPALLHERLAE